MRASRGASLGEAKGPSHPVELVRFEFVGELAEFSLLLVIGVLKHVGMQRLEIRFELRVVYVEAFQFGELFLGLFPRGECRQRCHPADLAPRPRVDGLFFGGFCAPRVAGAGRRRPRAVVAPGGGDVGEEFLDLLVLSGQEGDDVALVGDID
jgi:hypothetical protein